MNYHADIVAKMYAREQYERAYRWEREQWVRWEREFGMDEYPDISDIPPHILLAAYESKTAKKPNAEPFYLRNAERLFRDAQQSISELKPSCYERYLHEAITRLTEARANWYSMYLRNRQRWIAESRR